MADVPRRWDDDERGHGIADARRLVPGAEELTEAMSRENWVAEQPEAHLLPHLRAFCERDGRFRLEDARGDDDGAFVIDLAWAGAAGQVGAARAAAFALIGSVAESATYIRQRRETPALVFEVATGMLAPDAEFAPHGHVLIVRVAGVV